MMEASNKDGIDWILQDHRKLENIMNLYTLAQLREEKLKYADQLVKEISQHASLEEQYVYPLLRTRVRNGDFVWERYLIDDQINKELLDLIDKSLRKTTRGGDVQELMVNSEMFELFDKTVEKLKTVELEHLREEENGLKELQQHLSEREREDLFDTLEKAKPFAPTHPHPMAPNKPSTGSNILHPIAGTIDRFLDAASGRNVK